VIQRREGYLDPPTSTLTKDSTNRASALACRRVHYRAFTAFVGCPTGSDLSEVGEALVTYLSCDRVGEGGRQLFLTCRAPRAPIRADLVGDVVERACPRAGLPHVGPHRRHALAAELLRRGAGLVAISQVLRHQDLATTALYAKVDLVTLRMVAQPWPGATS